MNSVRGLGIAEIGDREAPIGPNHRQEEIGEEDRFKSVLSRIAGSVHKEVAPPDAEEGVAGGLASSVPDGRRRKPEAGEETPDDDLPGGAANALLVAERQVRMLPNRVEASREFPRTASEPGVRQRVVTVRAPNDDGMAAPGAVLVDPPASATPSEAGETPPFAAAGGFGPAALDAARPPANAGEPSARRTELIPLRGDDGAGEAESGRNSPPPELPRVTVMSREKHFAPAVRPDPVGRAIPPSDPEPDTPASPAKGQTAGPDAPPRNDRVAQAGGPPWAPIEPKSRPQNQQNQEPGTPRPPSAGIVPAPVVTTISSTEGSATPAAGAAEADQGLSQGIATPPEPSRTTAISADVMSQDVISHEKLFAPARRFDSARPATSDPQPEPLRSPVPGLAPVAPQAAARSARSAPENPPPSSIVPGSMPRLPERDERGRQSAGGVPAAASATTPSTETPVTPTSGVPGLGQELMQRISGAVVEAAGSAAFSAAAPVAAAGIADHASASAPARALTIRIDLHEHGAVHVRLALNGNALSLRMRADREEIAEQLRQDHHKLSDTLSAAGYDTEIVAIEGRRNDLTPPPGNDAASPAGADGAANADRGAGGENRRPTARQTQTPDQGSGENFLPHDQEDHEPRNIAQRRAGALYV